MSGAAGLDYHMSGDVTLGYHMSKTVILGVTTAVIYLWPDHTLQGRVHANKKS